MKCIVKTVDIEKAKEGLKRLDNLIVEGYNKILKQLKEKAGAK